MRPTRRRHRVLVLLSALVVLGTSASARAGNDDEVLLGSDASLSAGAVTATVSDAGAIIYNPAGLSFANRAAVDVSGSAIVVRAHHASSLLRSDDGASEDARFLEVVSIPSALAYTRPLGENVRLGFGVFGTRGSTIRILGSLEHQVEDRTSEWSASTWQTSSSLSAAISLAGTTSERFSLGVTGLVLYDAESSALILSASRVRPDATDPNATITDGFATLSSIDSAARFGVRTTVGMQWFPTDRLRIGASVASPAYSLVSSAVSAYAVEAYRGTGQPTGTHSARTHTGLHWSTGMFLPFRFRGGLAIQLERGGFVSFDADYQPRLRDVTLGVDRSGVWNVRAGTRVALSDEFAVGGGLFTDRSSTPLSDDPTSNAARRHFYGFTLGLEHAKEHRLGIGEHARSLIFVTNVSLRYAYGMGHTTGLRVGAEFDPDFTSSPSIFTTVPVDVATHELTVNIGSSIQF